MAVDYKPLNRNQEFSTPQKASLKKIMELAEAAASGGDSSLLDQTLVHLALSGHFPSNINRDIKALCKELRVAIDAADSSADLNSVFGAFSMSTSCKKVTKTMANAVVAQIV